MTAEDNEAQQPNEPTKLINYAEMMPATTPESTGASALGELTLPESRRYDASDTYRFLIHSTVQRDPREIYRHLTEGHEPGSEFRLTDHQLNTSLIDQAHTATFEGEGGFIIKPPRDPTDIRGAFASDGGGAEFIGDQALPTGDDLLARTAIGEYNHVNITAGTVEGVFIRIAADTGQELGNHGRNAVLREIAAQHNLPIAELSIARREIHEGPVDFEDAEATAGGGQLWHITIPREGHLYRIDIARTGEGAVGARVALVDGYDVWKRELTDTQFQEVTGVLEDLASSYPDDPAITSARAELTRQQPYEKP